MVNRTDAKIFPLALVAVVAIVHSGVAFTDERAATEPTVLESFVATAGVVFDLAEYIGLIRSSDAFRYETLLALQLDDLSGIEWSIPELESGGATPYRIQGTAACWQPKRPMRIL